MAATNDKGDDQMRDRLGRAFRNPENRAWAADYFAAGTHAGHTEPGERARHERHVAAVAQLQTDIAADHAAAQARAQVWQPVSTRQQIEAEIQRVYATPGWADSKSRDHQAAVDRLSYLYKQLHPSK